MRLEFNCKSAQWVARSFLIFVLSLLAFIKPIEAKESRYSDSMVRAAVILGILRFTTWPEQKNTDESIILCTYGSSPTDDALSELGKIPNIGSKSVILKSNIEKTQFSSCHAVIVGKSVIQKQDLAESTLFICDECKAVDLDFFSINLIQQANRIQFTVNLDSINEQNLNLSASLIELAAGCSSSDPNIRACNE